MPLPVTFTARHDVGHSAVRLGRRAWFLYDFSIPSDRDARSRLQPSRVLPIEAMSNGAFAGWHQVGGSDTHYAVAGVGDFSGDGTPTFCSATTPPATPGSRR